MILVTRYLLVSRIQSEVNIDLRSSLLGSDSISGSNKGVQDSVCTQSKDISCRLGVVSTFKDSDSRSAIRFPSQQNSSESVK